MPVPEMDGSQTQVTGALRPPIHTIEASRPSLYRDTSIVSLAHIMVSLDKSDIDSSSSSEQDAFETITLEGTLNSDYDRVPPKIRSAPTNYLCVSKKGVPIRGQYLIDVSILPVPQFLSDIAGAKNISLHTTSGAITADVWVIGDNKSKRVSVKLFSGNGPVRANIHDAFSVGKSEHRPSIEIEILAHYGDVSLSLPRCFRGPLTIRSSHERIAFSPALEELTAPLSDIQGVRMYFVGDRPLSGKWRGHDHDHDHNGEENAGVDRDPAEPLDAVSVSGWHTGVRIRWEGEPELPQVKQNGWENFCMGSTRFFTSGRVN